MKHKKKLSAKEKLLFDAIPFFEKIIVPNFQNTTYTSYMYDFEVFSKIRKNGFETYFYMCENYGGKNIFAIKNEKVYVYNVFDKDFIEIQGWRAETTMYYAIKNNLIQK
jgi:hypothetical protein